MRSVLSMHNKQMSAMRAALSLCACDTLVCDDRRENENMTVNAGTAFAVSFFASYFCYFLRAYFGRFYRCFYYFSAERTQQLQADPI